MNEGNGYRALAHRRRHPFQTAGADIADGEHTWKTRFEQMGSTSQWPLRRSQIIVGEVRAGLDESLRIERKTAIKPVRVWKSPSHHKDVPYVMGFNGSRQIV